MIKQTYKINASVSQVWQALVDPVVIEQWSGSKALMSDEVGFEFKFWDGDIWGTNTNVITEKLLEQDWFGGKWREPSKVMIELAGDQKGGCIVTLTHENLPESEEENFAQGWRDYYFNAMKELLEQ